MNYNCNYYLVDKNGNKKFNHGACFSKLQLRIPNEYDKLSIIIIKEDFITNMNNLLEENELDPLSNKYWKINYEFLTLEEIQYFTSLVSKELNINIDVIDNDNCYEIVTDIKEFKTNKHFVLYYHLIRLMWENKDKAGNNDLLSTIKMFFELNKRCKNSLFLNNVLLAERLSKPILAKPAHELSYHLPLKEDCFYFINEDGVKSIYDEIYKTYTEHEEIPNYAYNLTNLIYNFVDKKLSIFDYLEDDKDSDIYKIAFEGKSIYSGDIKGKFKIEKIIEDYEKNICI